MRQRTRQDWLGLCPTARAGDTEQGREEHDGLSDNVFSKVLGPGYIGEAIRLAREADPGAQLFINDFGVLDPGPKQDRYFRLVKELRESGGVAMAPEF